MKMDELIAQKSRRGAKSVAAAAGGEARAGVRPAKSRAGGDRRRLREAELLLEVARRMAGYDSLDEVLRALVEMTTDELGTERGSLFLNDPATNELYSRVAQGNIQREIRILNNSGIAGSVYTTGDALIIQDAYSRCDDIRISIVCGALAGTA